MHENFSKPLSPVFGPPPPAPVLFGRSGSALYWLTITFLVCGVFIADLYSPFGVAIPTSYVAALLLVLALPGAREKVLLALLSTALIILDYFLTPSSPSIPGWIPVFNDVLTVTLIWIIAGLGLRHRRAQDAMRRSEERFRALVEASSQIVWTADGAGNIIEDSPSWRAFTGKLSSNGAAPAGSVRTIRTTKRESICNGKTRPREKHLSTVSTAFAGTMDSGGGLP